MTNYSTTQTANLVALAGFIATILNYFGINIGSAELQAMLGAIAIAGGLVWSWWNRYKQGDLSVTGKRK